jgi:hypothetical protein
MKVIVTLKQPKAPAKRPRSTSLKMSQPLRDCAERLAHALREGYDDIHTGIASEIAGQRPTAAAVAVAAAVCALVDPLDRSILASALIELKSGSYRSVIGRQAEDFGVPPMSDLQSRAATTMYELAIVHAHSLGQDTDEAYADVARKIVFWPTSFAVAGTFAVRAPRRTSTEEVRRGTGQTRRCRPPRRQPSVVRFASHRPADRS